MENIRCTQTAAGSTRALQHHVTVRGRHTRRPALAVPSAVAWQTTSPTATSLNRSSLRCTSPGFRDQSLGRSQSRSRRRGAQVAASAASAAGSSSGDEESSRLEFPSPAGRDSEDSLAAVADRLSLAVAAEDYERAAALRDELARRTQDGREAVLAANQRFYDAFERCDPKAMADVWGFGEHVQCIHPVAGIIAGREDVLESWESVLGAGGSITIRLAEVRVALLGEATAYVTCTELINATDNRGRIAATNIFERQNGEWRIVHHHGSPSPPLRQGF